MENILQAFLDTGLLNMVDDDEKFKHLQDTAHDLAEKPSKTRIDVIKATLVSLDGEIPSAEPELERVEGALKKHWKTVKAKFPDVPRQLLRGVLLETLRRRAEKDVKTAAIIWLTGSSYFQHIKPGRDKSLCEAFLLEMGSRLEQAATKEWLGSYKYSPPEIANVDGKLNVKPTSINVEELTNQLAAAVGSTNVDGQNTGPDPNTYWPNQGQPWAHKFAPRAATGISQVINTSLGELVKAITDALQESRVDLSKKVAGINSAVEGAIGQIALGASIAERRGNLLWWRQTLYSPTLMLGYRDLDLSTAAVAMAHDLHKQIPSFYPQSLEFLLREAVRAVEDRQESQELYKISLTEFCKKLKTSDQAAALREALGVADNDAGRVPLLNLVKKAVAGETLDPAQIANHAGIPGKAELDFQELAVWMLRNMQAHALATQKD